MKKKFNILTMQGRSLHWNQPHYCVVVLVRAIPDENYEQALLFNWL